MVVMHDCRPPWYRRGWAPFWLSFAVSFVVSVSLIYLVVRIFFWGAESVDQDGVGQVPSAEGV